MDASSHQQRPNSAIQRQLASLKLVSRLLGHEMHSQSNAKSIALSREAIHEIQSTIDLYIEEVSRSSTGMGSTQGGVVPPRMVGSR